MRTISRSLFLTILLAIMLADGFSQQATTNLTQQEQNKQLVKTMNERFNQGKTTEALQYFSDSLTKMGNIGGKTFFVAMQDDIAQTFPDVQTKIITMWADGDWVIAECIFSGTHKGTAILPHHGGLLIGKAPTNLSFKVQHIRMYRIRDNKIIERKAVRDDVGMYQQLGLLPKPPGFVK